ncbi:DUF3060 domain-containing protein [Kerstersia gyiorum]|uniref:DUF3060 domain-containing protein n=1 Tax=Kerstersia gyiorum TaxID=206506 RepID=UPI00209E64DD|nr:DUF3060 domain-containing protein [Kerstersia gyiorum]MCP1679407.1 hypothetical protein [Kerstersia gyiorum]MCP1823910.1 hypothetical protein [Kerstersia gyiorum]MCP1827351.1 hypothetical protein [Kerstersia gyiorum]MCW2449000.1 hypothetical protein [Kerstersia gyiorum]
MSRRRFFGRFVSAITGAAGGLATGWHARGAENERTSPGGSPMAATLAPIGKQQYTDLQGRPLIGGRVFTYETGTSTPKVTYADSDMSQPNTNPVVLDARGEATIYWKGVYKVELRDWFGNLVWTADPVASSEYYAEEVDSLIRADLADGDESSKGTGMVFHRARPIRDRFDESPVLKDFPSLSAALQSTGFTVVQPEDIPALLYVTDPVQIRAENVGEVNVTSDAQGAFLFQGVVGAAVRDLRMRQRLDQPIAAGTENDFQLLKFRGGAFNRSIGNTFYGPLALSFMLGLPVSGNPNADRTSKFNIALGNIAPDNRGMFIETMGTVGAIIVANAGHCPPTDKTKQHGIRITGYTIESNAINAPNIGTVAAANVLDGYLTGVSVQNSAQLFDLGHLFIQKCTQAIQILSGSTRESDPKNGKLAFVARECQQYIRVGRSKNLTFEFVIDASVSNGTSPVIEELSHDAPYGGNTYRGMIFGGRTTGQTILLRHPDATLDVDVDDCDTGVTVSATASGAKGRISVRKIVGSGVTIAADNCNLVVSAKGTGGTYAIGVSGSGNTIIVETDGRLVVSGSNNEISGVVGGSIQNSGSNNDLKGIKGYSGRGVLTGVVPDANGDVTITLNSHPNSPRAFQASAWGGNNSLSVFVRTVTAAGTATIRIMNGASPHTGSCSVSYSY